MASLEVVALDTVTPQLRAPGAGDTYAVPRSMIMGDGLGYYGINPTYGMSFNGGVGQTNFFANGRDGFRVNGGVPYGVNVDYRVGLGAGMTSDVGIERIAVGVAKVSNGGTALASGAGVLQFPPFGVASLPTAANAGVGARSTVNDSNLAYTGANVGANVAAGGINIVPVYSDGTTWRIG